MKLKQIERKQYSLGKLEEEFHRRKAEVEKVAKEGLEEFSEVKSKFDWEILHFKKQVRRFRERLKRNEVHFERVKLLNGVYDGKMKGDSPHGIGRWLNFDGKRKVKAEWKDGLKDGIVVETVCQHHHLYQARKGKPHGKYIRRHRERTLFEREYQQGRLHGQSQFYDEKGSLICIEVHDNGQLREVKCRGKSRKVELVADQTKGKIKKSYIWKYTHEEEQILKVECYDENGQLRNEYFFQNGDLQSKEFFRNGKTLQE